MSWYTVEVIGPGSWCISEYAHWEETHCYLLTGAEKALLLDTGLGIGKIREQVDRLTALPVQVLTTHAHWDHIGGHQYFPDFCAHGAELDWLNGAFPLPAKTVRAMVLDRCDPPEDFDIDAYTLFQGAPARVLRDGDAIDLGGRSVRVLHTPGHSPGHMCFWEEETGYLFTGDLVYKDTLLAYYPSTDPAAYLASLEKIAALPVRRVFPAHHSLDIQPEIILRMRDAFRQLQAEGKLRHGSGTFSYGDWAVWL